MTTGDSTCHPCLLPPWSKLAMRCVAAAAGLPAFCTPKRTDTPVVASAVAAVLLCVFVRALQAACPRGAACSAAAGVCRERAVPAGRLAAILPHAGDRHGHIHCPPCSHHQHGPAGRQHAAGGSVGRRVGTNPCPAGHVCSRHRVWVARLAALQHGCCAGHLVCAGRAVCAGGAALGSPD